MNTRPLRLEMNGIYLSVWHTKKLAPDHGSAVLIAVLLLDRCRADRWTAGVRVGVAVVVLDGITGPDVLVVLEMSLAF